MPHLHMPPTLAVFSENIISRLYGMIKIFAQYTTFVKNINNYPILSLYLYEILVASESVKRKQNIPRPVKAFVP